jgi:hypothetical protein
MKNSRSQSINFVEDALMLLAVVNKKAKILQAAKILALAAYTNNIQAVES